MTIIQRPGIFTPQENLEDAGDETKLLPQSRRSSSAEASARSLASRNARPHSADGRSQATPCVGTAASSSSLKPPDSAAVLLSGPNSSALGVVRRASSARLEHVPEADVDVSAPSVVEVGRRTLMPRVRLPTSQQLAMSLAVPPELLLETVRSSATSGTGADFRAHSAVSGGGSGVLVAPPLRRKELLASRKLPTDLMVSLPAGGGSASGSAVEMEAAPNSKTSRQIESLEHELQFMRLKHEEELDRERSNYMQRLRRSEDEAQRRVAALDGERDTTREEAVSKAHEFHEAILAEKKTTAQLEAELHEAREELVAQAQALEKLHTWKFEASTSEASLSKAERRCEDHAKTSAQLKQHAAGVAHQRKELSRRNGVRACHELREELTAAKSERSELEKRLKRALPRIDRLTAEEQRLRVSLARESETAAAHSHLFMEESSELSKMRDQLQKLRRSAKSKAGQHGTLEMELAEADRQCQNTKVELSKSQKLHKEEQKRCQGATAERESLHQLLEELKERVRSSEVQKPASAGNVWTPIQRPLQEARRQPASGSLRQVSNLVHQQPPQPSEVEPVSACSAGSKLFEMIELAKERADQRRHLNDATEEVREQARALEELLA